MRQMNDLLSNLPRVFLNIASVTLLCVTCSAFDYDTEPIETEYLEGDWQSNTTAVQVLRNSEEFKKILLLDGLMTYRNVTPNDNILIFLLPSAERLTVVFTPCDSFPITWRLVHRPPSETGPSSHVFSPSSKDEMFFEEKGVEPSIFKCANAPYGLYQVQVLSERNTTVQIHASTTEGGQGVVNISRVNNTRIKVEKIFDTDPPTARLLLPALNIELEQFLLVFVISKKRFYRSLCSVRSSHPDKTDYVDEEFSCNDLQNDSELQICREDGHRTLIDLQLQVNNLYFITVFAWDIATGVSVQYSKINFKFKLFPIRLFDGKPRRINMTTNGGKVSFKYKTGKHNNSKLLFYVFPCADLGSTTVEVKFEKRTLQKKQINKYEQFEISAPQANHRYVIIIRSSGSPTSARSCDLVEVMATVRPRVYPLPPKYPSDIRVNATIKTPCSSSAGTRNTTISWLPVITTEELTYCVFVNPINETADHLYNSTDTFYSLLKQSPKHRKCTLLPPWNKMQRHVMPLKLRRHTNYTVQVIVKRRIESKQFFTYEVLNVHSVC